MLQRLFFFEDILNDEDGTTSTLLAMLRVK